MSDQTAWSGKYLEVRRRDDWEYVTRGGIGAVVILAIDDDHVLLVEQHRIPLGRRCLELPAGLVGDDAADETPEAAGRRELVEETGYRAARVEVLGDFSSSPGLTDESFTLLRASMLQRIGDPEDGIVLHRVRLIDVPDFVAARRRADVAVDVKLWLLLGADYLKLSA